MFLHQRCTQREHFDEPTRTLEEVREGYRLLEGINQLTRFADPFKQRLPPLLGADQCRSLTLLDLGAGDGSLGRELTSWAAQRGWSWRVTSLDLNPKALRVCGAGPRVAGSALALPFGDGTFEVVVATSMTHHLESDADVRRHFREAWRVARTAILICDLHRNPLLLAAVWLAVVALRGPAHFRSDAVVSVRRGWRVPEWQRLAREAAIPHAQVRWLHGARVVLQARKPHAAVAG